MEIEFYTPPYDQIKPGLPKDEMGMLVLHFKQTVQAEDGDIIIGLQFSQTDEESNIVRHPFNVDGWRGNMYDPFCSEICLANLDEAWRVICLLGSMLQIQKIEISYGAYT